MALAVEGKRIFRIAEAAWVKRTPLGDRRNKFSPTIEAGKRNNHDAQVFWANHNTKIIAARWKRGDYTNDPTGLQTLHFLRMFGIDPEHVNPGQFIQLQAIYNQDDGYEKAAQFFATTYSPDIKKPMAEVAGMMFEPDNGKRLMQEIAKLNGDNFVEDIPNKQRENYLYQ